VIDRGGLPIRRLLLVPAALGVAALVFPTVAGARDRQAEPPADQPVAEVALTEPAEPAAPGFQETVKTDDNTNLIGIKWNGAPQTEFTVEVQEDDGSWTAPYGVEGMDIGPDAGTKEAAQVVERRGSAYVTEPVSVDDPSKVRVRVADGVATDVEFVTVGGDPAEPVADTAPPSTAPPTTSPPSTAPSTTPPTPTNPPEPPAGPPAAEASLLTWTGLILLGATAAGTVVLRSRRDQARRRRAGLGITMVVIAIVAAGCFGGGGGGGRATTPAPWPGVFGRAHWGGPDIPACAGYTSNVRFAVVHHTGGGPQDNNYTNSAAKIRGIYDYHVGAGGYCDIAYNFLVDKWGTLWEGRAGGMHHPVMGAHTLGYNSDSTGVAILGDFTSQNAPAAAQDALVRLLAWKFTVHHVDPTVPVWANGRWINAVSAHRELTSTSCPGDAFYPSLPGLRNAVAARAFYGPPIGTWDGSVRTAGGVRVAGWALDPDTPDPIAVHVYVASTGYAVLANLSRPDIAALFPEWGAFHGFEVEVPAPPYPVTVCVFAVNVSHGGGHPPLGCRTL
jgi:hypothetical protein